jgi:hypothetical protein
MVIEENISESEYRPFPTQKKNIGDQNFADDREVETVQIRWLITQDKN